MDAAQILLPVSTPPWALGLLMILVGLGGPLTMPPTMATLLDHASDRHAGTASGLFNTSRQIGGALAVAVFGGLLVNADTFMAGVRTSLLVAAATVAATVVAGLLPRTPPTMAKQVFHAD